MWLKLLISWLWANQKNGPHWPHKSFESRSWSQRWSKILKAWRRLNVKKLPSLASELEGATWWGQGTDCRQEGRVTHDQQQQEMRTFVLSCKKLLFSPYNHASWKRSQSYGKDGSPANSSVSVQWNRSAELRQDVPRHFTYGNCGRIHLCCSKPLS